MLKPSMLSRLLLLFAPLALASCSTAPVRDADPALWVVKDDDTTIYLFGTLHILKPGTAWLDDGIRTALDQSQEVILELKPGEAPPGEIGVAKVPLPQQIPAETLRKLKAALVELGQSPDALDRFDPWFAAVTLSNMASRKQGYSVDAGVEQALTADAGKRGVRLGGFETMAEQLGYLAALSPRAQLALLDSTLDGLPKAGATLDATESAWAAGDPAALERLMNAELKTSPELADTMLVQRNRRWAAWIEARMARPGTVFVAVGAGHLAGPDSVQHILMRNGAKVARVAY
jgi:uncharacterized protein YbaP (TraB family)